MSADGQMRPWQRPRLPEGLLLTSTMASLKDFLEEVACQCVGCLTRAFVSDHMAILHPCSSVEPTAMQPWEPWIHS